MAWRPRGARTVSSTTGAVRDLASLEAHPDLTVLEVLLLPDGDRLLERVDRVAAGLERVTSMGGRDGDQHARLPDLQPTHPVQHGDSLHAGPARMHRVADLAHLCLGHGGVGPVLQGLYRPPAPLRAPPPPG